jgi:hypothetical protein
MTNTLAPTKTWNTALKMEGFSETHPFDDQSDLDSMSKTMGILTQEGIEIWEALKDNAEWHDYHSGEGMRHIMCHTHLANIFPQPEGMNVEDYLHYLLDQID